MSHPQPPPGIEPVDWLFADRTLLQHVRRGLSRQLRYRPTLRPWLQGLLSSMHGPVARQRVRHGMRMLSRGRVVVSDRLHGHVLSLLLGIPNMVLDNRYGKVRGMFNAWTHASPLGTWCESEAEALERALELAGD